MLTCKANKDSGFGNVQGKAGGGLSAKLCTLSTSVHPVACNNLQCAKAWLVYAEIFAKVLMPTLNVMLQ